MIIDLIAKFLLCFIMYSIRPNSFLPIQFDYDLSLLLKKIILEKKNTNKNYPRLRYINIRHKLELCSNEKNKY